MVEIDQWSKPNIEQFAELAMGVLPREFRDEMELTPQARTVYEAGQRLWARPSAGNFNDSETPESWQRRPDAARDRLNNGNGYGKPLAIQAKEVVGRLWPRPQHADGQRASLWIKRREGNNPTLLGAAQETMGRLWMRPSVSDLHFRLQGDTQAAKRSLETQSRQVAQSLTGLRCPTTTTDGAPSSPPDLTSLRLSPWFDEWLLFGRAMIGWTCVCPARALARAVAGSPPSATPSVPTRPQEPCERSGIAHSGGGRE